MGNSESRSTHMVHVTTGVKKGAGASANVYVALGDENGKWSNESKIKTGKSDFEPGKTDAFDLELPNMGKITEMSVRRDDSGLNDSWYLEKVTVKDLSTRHVSTFPLNRWIHPNTQQKFSEFDSTLPAQDKYAEQRKRELEQKRQVYQLVAKQPGIPKQVETLPDDENFTPSYAVFFGSTLMQLTKETEKIAGCVGEFKSLDDFDDVYTIGAKVTRPAGVEKWKEDAEFGEQRISGVNPGMLQLCEKIPDKFPVQPQMVESFLEGKTLQQAIQAQKIYLVDLTFIENIPCTKPDNQVCAPYGLFYVKDNGDLVPIAIQLMPNPGSHNPIFLPTDPEYTWLIAKMWFNLADASIHQSTSHLGLTHILMESVCVCTHRQLSPSHPIFKLLSPHFLHLLAINDGALKRLIAEGTWIDQVMEMGRIGAFEIIRRKWANWNLMSDGHLPNNLKLRGVSETDTLKNYPYRDDGLLVWDAIKKYVTAVVSAVYEFPESLLNDPEIQEFAKELSHPERAGIKGVPEKFTTSEELIDVLTVFIFTSSVQHAAVNFGQYDEYGFSPNYPASMRIGRPTNKDALSEDDVVKSLPTKEEMLSVIKITRLLSSRATNPLGYFDMPYADNPSANAAVNQFKEDLKAAEEVINERNLHRVRKYKHLLPSRIPNAISI